MRTYSQLLPLRLHGCQRSSSNRLHTRIIIKLSNDRRHHRIPSTSTISISNRGLEGAFFSCDTLFLRHRRKCTSLSPFNKTKSMGIFACNNLQMFDTMLLQSIDNLFPFSCYTWLVSPIVFHSYRYHKQLFFCLFLDVYIYVFRALFYNVEYHSHLDVLVSKKLTISKKVGGRFLFRCATPALVGSQYQGSPKVAHITCSSKY